MAPTGRGGNLGLGKANIVAVPRDADIVPIGEKVEDLPAEIKSDGPLVARDGPSTNVRSFILPALPEMPERNSRALVLSFLILVVLPFAAIVYYYFAIAADQYTTEFRFSVTEVNPTLPSITSTPGTSSSSSGGSLTSGSGGASGAMASIAAAASSGGGMSLSTGSPQNYVVVDYLQSRQVVEDLLHRVDLRKMYGRAAAGGDFWASVSPNVPVEKLVSYWKGMITANFDPITGLAFAEVRAFSRQDALTLGTTLVSLAEEQANRTERRAQMAAIGFAKSEVDRTQRELTDTQKELLQFRSKEGVIDPSGSIGTNTTLRQTLRATLIQQQSDLAAIVAQHISLTAPTAMALRAQINATEDQLKIVEKEVSKNSVVNAALADVVGRYEKLDQQRQYAQAMLIAANQNYDQARANAAAQHVYLTPYVMPTLPESSTYPNRVRALIIVAIALTTVWAMGYMAFRSISEHL